MFRVPLAVTNACHLPLSPVEDNNSFNEHLGHWHKQIQAALDKGK
jgi:hypothetical protein